MSDNYCDQIRELCRQISQYADEAEADGTAASRSVYMTLQLLREIVAVHESERARSPDTTTSSTHQVLGEFPSRQLIVLYCRECENREPHERHESLRVEETFFECMECANRVFLYTEDEADFWYGDNDDTHGSPGPQGQNGGDDDSSNEVSSSV
ncbi:hypothetical protein QR680_003000 [Steinernema hermaphroditum]|uniref:Uncharacterized protein n=1 Tax=Steinernema hermaphroditum TaxID=289476 RepID=A0AA39LJB7_9BILA|nr:hypothetical protein QR680_003000 [Steinernema hermaphroditum]